MVGLSYFLDTYAIIEIIKGNLNYARFIGETSFTSVFKLYELYYLLLKDYGKDIAEKEFIKFKQNVIKISDESIFRASQFRLENIKKHYSYTDCFGYVLSLENDFIFLTGDDAFKGLKNVEFVK